MHLIACNEQEHTVPSVMNGVANRNKQKKRFFSTLFGIPSMKEKKNNFEKRLDG